MVQEKQNQDQIGLSDILMEMADDLSAATPMMVYAHCGDLRFYLFVYESKEEHYRRCEILNMRAEKGKIAIESKYTTPEELGEYTTRLGISNPDADEEIKAILRNIYSQMEFFYDIYSVDIVLDPSDRLKEWLGPDSGNNIITAEMLQVTPKEWCSD